MEKTTISALRADSVLEKVLFIEMHQLFI